jgi:hypothetical protein
MVTEGRVVTEQRRPQMYPLMDSRIALEHIADLRRQADRARLVHSIQPAPNRRPLRASLGVRLVAVGLRLLDPRH